MSKSEKIRDSNFELLRIICMLLIIAGHLTKQSGILLQSNGEDYNKVIAIVLGSASGICDNIFVMISAWFLCEKRFEVRRILKTYTQVAFYCIPITILMLIFFPKYMGIKDMVRGFFPYSGSPLWFATVYISMLLLSPFMNSIIQNRAKTQKLLLLLFFINTVPSTFLLRNDFFYSGEIVWFCFIYLLIGYMKKYKIKFRVSAIKCFIVSGVIYLLLLAIYFIVESLSQVNSSVGNLNQLMELSTYFINRYHTIPAFVCSFFFFIGFSKLKIHNNIINLLSTGCFSVYIIHQSPGFADFMWYKLFKVEKWYHSKYYLLYYLSTVCIIFSVGSIIDFIRRNSLDKFIVSSKIYENIEYKIMSFYKEIV